MGMFDFSGVKDRIKAAPPSMPVAGLGEATDAAWDEIRRTKSSFSAPGALGHEYEKYRQIVKEKTGQELSNPFNLLSFSPSLSSNETDFFDKVSKLREEFPEIPENSPEQIRSMIGKRWRASHKKAADVSERAQGFIASSGSFLGSGGAVLSDPIIWPTFAFGYGFGASFAKGVLVDAAIAAGTETILQAKIQTDRQQFGEEADISEALQQIGLTAVGGAAFSGLLRGGVKGTKALLGKSKQLPPKARTPEVRGAEILLEREQIGLDLNPYPSTPEGRVRFQQEFEAAVVRLTESDTAIGRVNAARESTVKIDLEVTPLARGPSVEEFFNSVRVAKPVPFRKLSEIDTQIAKLEKELAASSKKVEALGSLSKQQKTVDALRGDIAKATDARKIKRLKRKLAEAEQALGKGSATASKRLKALHGKQKKQRTELKRLAAQRKAAAKRVDQAAQTAKVKHEPKTALGIRARAMLGEPLDLTTVAAHDMVNLAEVLHETVARDPSLGSVTPGGRVPDPYIPPVEARATEAAVDDTLLEAQVREAIASDPGAEMKVPDADGNPQKITGEELLEDLESDAVLLKEIQNCIAGLAT